MLVWQLFIIMTVWIPLFTPQVLGRQFNNIHSQGRKIPLAFHNNYVISKPQKQSQPPVFSTSYFLTQSNENCILNNFQSYHQSTTTKLYQSTTNQPLKTLEGNTLYNEEESIKKSRFIGIATHCTSWEEAQTHLANVRAEHPKSRHVCFGFVSSSSSSGGGETGVGTERCSDDGEPTGTAGVPILGAIKGEGLSDVLCIVVRYFGGIKLGAGGLIRAYGSAARLVLRSAPTEIHIPKATMRLSTRTANSGAVYAAAAKFGGVTSGECYNDRGELEVSITCDLENEERLKEDVVDATRGGVMFIE